MNLVEWLVEPLQYGFMVRALGATLVAAITCALLSCWLVQIGWSLMGDAVSHSVLPGVVFAYILGWPFAVGAFIFGVGAVALIGGIQSSTRIKADAAIGVVFTSLFALGIVLISVTPSQTDLGHILFGNLLGVSEGDFWQVLGIGAVTCATLVLKRRDFTLFAFDALHAHAIGINTRLLRVLLLGMLALTVVITLQAVGIVLVVAMLVIPGATAYLVARSMGGMLLLAVCVTCIAAVTGAYLSYHLDTATGGSVVLAQATLFVLAYLVGPRGGVLPRALRRRRDARRTPASVLPAAPTPGQPVPVPTMREDTGYDAR